MIALVLKTFGSPLRRSDFFASDFAVASKGPENAGSRGGKTVYCPAEKPAWAARVSSKRLRRESTVIEPVHRLVAGSASAAGQPIFTMTCALRRAAAVPRRARGFV